MAPERDFQPYGETDRVAPFRFSAVVRVGFDETDAQGVVYYGRYLPYFDRARVEYRRHLGLLHSEPEGAEFVMRALHVEYQAPARFDDLVEVFLRVKRLGRTSVTWELRAQRLADDQLLCTAEQTLVLIDAAARVPRPLAEASRRIVEGFERALEQ